jgi:hypothetical protein
VIGSCFTISLLRGPDDPSDPSYPSGDHDQREVVRLLLQPAEQRHHYEGIIVGR